MHHMEMGQRDCYITQMQNGNIFDDGLNIIPIRIGHESKACLGVVDN